jgi:transcriptional regulator of acetoin/glycerol metabolism
MCPDEPPRPKRTYVRPLKIAPELNKTIDEVSRAHVLTVLAACQGNVGYAARILGVDRKTVSRWLRRWRAGG